MRITILMILLIWGTASTCLAQNTYPFPSSGPVGIGTTSPANTLDVVGGINASSTSAIVGIAFSTVATYYKQLQAAGYNFQILSGDGTSKFSLPYNNSAPARLENYGLAVDNYLSIGTTSTTSTYPLQVVKSQDAATSILVTNPQSSTTACAGVTVTAQYQTINLTAFSDGFSRPYPGFHSSATAIFGNASNGLNIISNAGAGGVSSNTGAIRFITDTSAGGISSNGNGNDAETRMIITGTGQVGIGILAPVEKLCVNGNIRANGNITARKISVTQGGWPDYVFASGYKLPSLTDISQFIQKNKRLPGIPSAKEVEQKGINIGENQALLLRKIEELTLYVIELKKENIEQNNEIQQLRSQIHQ